VRSPVVHRGVPTTLNDTVTSAEPGFACGADVSKGLLQLRMNNVTSDGTTDWTDRRRVPADAGNPERYGLEPGDIMFNCTNSPDLVGKTALFNGFSEPVAYSNHFLRVRVNRKRAEPGYVARWLYRQWQRREFERLAICWVNQATVRKDDLLDMQIDLPELPIQRRIAGILDEADRLRRMRRYALELPDQFLPAFFLRMFGDPERNIRRWGVLTMDDACEKIADGTHFSPPEVPTGIPYITAKNIKEDGIDLTELTFVSEEHHRDIYRRCDPRLGDVLYIKDGVPPE
jgi:type I restriction enzyme S subunit